VQGSLPIVPVGLGSLPCAPGATKAVWESTASRLSASKRLLVPRAQKSSDTPSLVLPTRQGLSMPDWTRRVHVANIAEELLEDIKLVDWFNANMSAIGGNVADSAESKCVTRVYTNKAKGFAFVEFRNSQEASNAMVLDGLHVSGIPLRIRRPKDYDAQAAQGYGSCLPTPNLQVHILGLKQEDPGDLRRWQSQGSNTGDSTHRVFVGGLPHNCSDVEIKKLLESYGGPVRHLDLPWSHQHMTNKGYCFVVFQNVEITDNVIKELNGLVISGARKLTARRATPNGILPGGVEPQQAKATQASERRAIIITGISREETLDSETCWLDIRDDMHEECQKSGKVEHIYFSRTGGTTLAGGKRTFSVYALFETATVAEAAQASLHKRLYDGEMVSALLCTQAEMMQLITPDSGV